MGSVYCMDTMCEKMTLVLEWGGGTLYQDTQKSIVLIVNSRTSHFILPGPGWPDVIEKVP